MCWTYARRLYHPGFRVSAVLLWVGGVVALWPGTWWCLLPAILGACYYSARMEEVKKARGEAGLPADPFSREGERQHRRVVALREMGALYARGWWTPEE